MVGCFSRYLYYFNIQAAAVIPDSRPSPDWPDRGHVTFNSYSTRYREGLDLVLKDIKADFPSGTKVSSYICIFVLGLINFPPSPPCRWELWGVLEQESRLSRLPYSVSLSLHLALFSLMVVTSPGLDSKTFVLKSPLSHR